VTICKCAGSPVCPIVALNEYLEKSASQMKVNISQGYLLRLLDKQSVLDSPVSYSSVYERLRKYLTMLGIYEGETPHSFRAGCALTLTLSGAGSSVADLQQHIGWKSNVMPDKYVRGSEIRGQPVASNLARVMQSETIVSAGEENKVFGSCTFESLMPLSKR